ncbi:MAG: PilZ domain-containing protein [Candidatus Eremiobacteraeota bacterium]|nr:PilZ domain-containing protein [Candidatus Eremiobacteraeota bacterium]
MLKNILGIFKGPKAEEGPPEKKQPGKDRLFSLENCRITAVIPPRQRMVIRHMTENGMIFKCALMLAEQEAVTFQLTYFHFDDKKPPQVLELPIMILKKGSVGEKDFLYEAQFLKPRDGGLLKFFEYLSELEKKRQGQIDLSERRDSLRQDRVLSVFSKNIKGYKGLTRDLSASGMMVVCDGGLQKGEEIDLSLELDEYGVEPLKLRGEVRWVVVMENEKIRAGIRFLEISRQHRTMIENYVNALKPKEDE